jgi:hypothetical protein
MTARHLPPEADVPPRAAEGALLARFRHPRAHLGLIGLALALLLPALAGGLMLDDYVLALQARGDTRIAGLPGRPWLMFSFTSGRAEDNHALIDQGVLLPWWGDPHHLNAFFRPLSALTHRLDFALWPEQAWAMHAHSLLWFAALLLVVAHVYRTLDGREGRAPLPAPAAPTAILALALFALDDNHGMTITWIANRNALIATALALPALSAHHRYRAHGWWPGAWLGPLCFALGLCGGETAVAVFGYLLAYAACLDRGPLARRALSMAPFVALIVAWRVVFVLLGLGSQGSGAYHDPAHEPLAYAAALAHHLPVLLSSQLGLPLADNWFWGPPSWDAPIWLLSITTVSVLLLLGHVLLREDRAARFWMVGMLLSACAVSASLPGERLVLVPGIGGSMFIAKLIYALWPRAGVARPPWMRGACAALVLVHLVSAPLALPARAWSMHVLESAVERTDRAIPSTPAVTDKTVVVINTPADMLLNYLQVMRAERGVPRPRHLYWLSTASSPLTLTTLDDSTLRIRASGGFVLSPPERHYRADPSTLSVGSTVALSDMTVRVVETTPDRRPAVADFRFATPLRSEQRVFFSWQHGQLMRFVPPPPGRRVQFPRVDFFRTMNAEAMRLLYGSW